MKEKFTQSIHIIISIVVAGVVLFGLWTLHQDHAQLKTDTAVLSQIYSALTKQSASSLPSK